MLRRFSLVVLGKMVFSSDLFNCGQTFQFVFNQMKIISDLLIFYFVYFKQLLQWGQTKERERERNFRTILLYRSLYISSVVLWMHRDILLCHYTFERLLKWSVDSAPTRFQVALEKIFLDLSGLVLISTVQYNLHFLTLFVTAEIASQKSLENCL